MTTCGKVVYMTNEMSCVCDADVINLYATGKSIKDVSKELGVSDRRVTRILKSNGIQIRTRRIPAPSDFIERYEDGESVLELSKAYGVSRSVVKRWLSDAGVQIRSYAEAGLVRAAKMSPEDRAAQAKAAHDATRGKRMRTISKVRHARTVQALASLEKCTDGERLIAETFMAHGYDVTLQKSVHIYNLDIAIGDRFAVEVYGGNFHADRVRRIKESERLEYLLGAGWTIVYAWNTKIMPLTREAAEKCVSIMEQSSLDPTVDGEYWVIRGDGKVTTSASRDVNDVSLKLPSHKRLYVESA